MSSRTVASLLEGAELWERRVAFVPSAQPAARAGSPGVLVAGWEAADPFCATVCTNDTGLAFCRRCPEEIVGQVLATGRARRSSCRAGVELLAFPAPAGSRRQVAVLRVAGPRPETAERAARLVRVPGATLREAARRAPEPAAASAILAAARHLRSAEELTRWRVRVRQRGAEDRRATSAALAQMAVTAEEHIQLLRATRRHAIEIERQRRRLDDLAREATTSAARERARIAHWIHDTAAQTMVSAFHHLEAARATTPDGDLRGQLDEASERLAEAIREVRLVLNDLVPPGLDELGLGPAVGRRLEMLAARTGVATRLTGTLPRLPPATEQALYAMTVEAMTNAVRHGRPGTVEVDLQTVRGRVVIEVRDDGAGFHATASPKGRQAADGLGLLGLARQATWLGGRTTIRSRPGGGTRVRISVPLDRSAPARHGRATPPPDPSPEATS